MDGDIFEVESPEVEQLRKQHAKAVAVLYRVLEYQRTAGFTRQLPAFLVKEIKNALGLDRVAIRLPNFPKGD